MQGRGGVTGLLLLMLQPIRALPPCLPPLPRSLPSPQTVGLQLVGATRASFLVQATVLITPLLSLAAGYRPGKRVWGACAMALAGCLLITADKAEAGAAVATGGFHLGE